MIMSNSIFEIVLKWDSGLDNYSLKFVFLLDLFNANNITHSIIYFYRLLIVDWKKIETV